jgi:hypothetical protein
MEVWEKKNQELSTLWSVDAEIYLELVQFKSLKSSKENIISPKELHGRISSIKRLFGVPKFTGMRSMQIHTICFRLKHRLSWSSGMIAEYVHCSLADGTTYDR